MAKLETILSRLEAARAELDERIAVERLRDRQVKALSTFLEQNPLVTKADVRKAAAAMAPDAVRAQGVDLAKPGRTGRGNRGGLPPEGLGTKLAAARTNKGITVVALARKLGVNADSVAKWESGGHPWGPQAKKTRAKLVEVLGLSERVFAPRSN